MKPWFFSAMLCSCLAAPAEAQEIVPLYDQQRCRPAVEQVLMDMGMTPDQVLSINLKEKVIGAFNNRRLIGFDAWVRPVEDNGYLVIQLGIGCGVQQIYTTGDYSRQGADHY